MPFSLRPLSPADVDAVQHLLEASPGYMLRTSGAVAEPGDGAAVLDTVPPEAGSTAKTVLGLFDADDGLVALCDLVAHWPEPGTVHIGLLLVREDMHGRELGRMLHDSALAQLRADRSLVRVRAAIVATNSQAAEPFWSRLGYRPTGSMTAFEHGSVVSTSEIWARPIVHVPPHGIHHLELWTADLTTAEPAWDWLLTTLGWSPEPVAGWDRGRIWRHSDGGCIVLEQSDDGHGERADRLRPGMNHVALTAPDPRMLDALRDRAGQHGWQELFADRYPHAGGEEHCAWYGESAEGIEVEVVALSRS